MKNKTEITIITNTKSTDRKDETKMKKTNIKTRIIASVLSVITIVSVGTIAITGASAAEKNKTFEDNAKSWGIQTADAAFDTIGDAFPGAKILVAPLKGLFHTGVDDETNPLDTINNKLDNMDNKLDDISNKLDDLNNTVNKNTEWMGQKIENVADMTDLRSDFKGLSPQVAKLVKDIKAAETNPDLNKSQKIMRLAAITDTQRFDNVTTYIYNIRKAMDGTDPAYIDMFKALYSKYAANCMFAREAYRAATPTAEALVEQYVLAVLLTEECQTATQAVSKFTDKNIKELGTDLDTYNKFDRYRHSMDNDDSEKALITAAVAVKDFRAKYDRPLFINKNAKTEGKLLKLGQVGGYNYVWDTNPDRPIKVADIANKNALTTNDLTAIADYVRKNYSGKSLYQFLVRDMGIESNVSNEDCYVLVSNKVNTSKDRNSSIDCKNSGLIHYTLPGYDRVGTVSAIKMSDPKVTAAHLKLYSYQSWDDDWCSKLLGTYYDVKTSTASVSYHDYLTIQFV